MSHRPGWNVSLRSLATANNCGLDNIRGAVNELIEAGYLERSERRDRNDQGHLTDYVYVTKDPSESPTLDSPTLVSPTLDKPTTKKTIEKEDEESKKLPHAPHEVDASESAFEQFWTAYPRKVEKLDARKAFLKAWATYGVAILAGVYRLAEDPNLPPKQFIPYPASWLNAGGWDSEPFPPRERTAEEKAEAEQIARDRRRAMEKESSRLLLEEAQRARREAEANPPQRCEHDRVKVMCPKCSPIHKMS